MLAAKSRFLFVLCLVLLLLPVAPAFAGLCSVVCTETTSCSQWCREGERITCGDYGVCAYVCVPNYQIVSSQVVALLPFNYSNYCDEVLAYEYVNHDVNNCPESSDYLSCSYGTLHSHPSGQCCLDVTCGASSSPCVP